LRQDALEVRRSEEQPFAGSLPAVISADSLAKIRWSSHGAICAKTCAPQFAAEKRTD
jgi:hypothetical protein